MGSGETRDVQRREVVSLVPVHASRRVLQLPLVGRGALPEDLHQGGEQLGVLREEAELAVAVVLELYDQLAVVSTVALRRCGGREGHALPGEAALPEALEALAAVVDGVVQNDAHVRQEAVENGLQLNR